jgi:hypothetical protein
MELQAEHERLLQRLGLEPEGRKYTPHVTLARLRDSSSHQVAEYLSARAHYRSASFEVSRFVLFSSRSSVGGGPYVVEADYPLERSASSAAAGAPPGERSERWGRNEDVHPHPDFASLVGPPPAGEGD